MVTIAFTSPSRRPTRRRRNREKSRSFAANVEKHVFHCFQCGAAGNALELYTAVHPIGIYRAAVELCERLDIEVPEKTESSFNREPQATAIHSGARRTGDM